MADRFIAIIGEAFWLLSLGLIAMFAFFSVLGALDPSDVKGLTGLVVVLAILFGFRLVAMRRKGTALSLEERRSHDRERRGF
jgi:uncharacterized membrane protein YhaH (DUF805 family)